MLGQKLMNVSSDVMNHLSMEGNEDKADLNTHYHSMLLSCFNLGFEVHGLHAGCAIEGMDGAWIIILFNISVHP